MPEDACLHTESQDADAEHATRGQARQQQRASWLRTREEERRWAERWRAAGERLRSASATSAQSSAPPPPSTAHASPAVRPTGARPTPRPEVPTVGPPLRPEFSARAYPRRPEPVQPPSPTARSVAPSAPTVSRPATTSSPAGAPLAGQVPMAPPGWGRSPSPVARPRPIEPRASVPPARRPPVERRPAPAGTDPHVPAPRPAPAPVPAPVTPAAGPESRALALPEQPFAAPPALREIPTRPLLALMPPAGDSPAASLLEAETRHTAIPLPEPLQEPEPSPSAAPPQTPSDVVADAGVIGATPYVADTERGRRADWGDATIFSSDTATTAFDPAEAPSTPTRPERNAVRRTSRSGGRSRKPSGGRAGAPSPPASPAVEPAPHTTEQDRPREERSARAQRLPTAREILAAQGGSRGTDPAARTRRPTARRGRTAPLPTLSREPAAWNIPPLLGWLPAVLLALTVGSAGILLAWSWSLGAEHAGVLADRLERASATARPEPLPQWVTPPDRKWWKSTAGQLMLWALERERTAPPNDLAAAEEMHELLSAAAAASPLLAPVRFARARLAEAVGPPPAEPGPSHGPGPALSRDVVTLAWTGNRLLTTGKKDAALRAYKAAFEMAASAELSRLAAPAFNEDTQIRRYALPGEDLVGPIVRSMAGSSAWTYAEWSGALPAAAVVRLAAARALRERSIADADADSALDSVLALAEAPPAGRRARAIHLAAQAEARAIRQEWERAEELYREAIAMMPDATVKRSWWMNVAEIALRQNNDSNRQKALEAAKGNDLNDEIARRAVELLKYHGVRSEQGGADDAPNRSANALR